VVSAPISVIGILIVIVMSPLASATGTVASGLPQLSNRRVSVPGLLDTRCRKCLAPLDSNVGIIARAAGQSLQAEGLIVDPLEERLSVGTADLFKSMRYGIRRTARFLRWSAKRWAGWLVRSFAFLLLVLLAPLLDRALLTAWKENGWRGLRNSILLGLAVHTRLLLDRKAPLLGKLLVILAVAYGVVSQDLLPDASFPVGILDDVLAVVLASRGFLLLCPESLVQMHAMRAARANERIREWHRAGIGPPVR
jgi:uncharacterized membrane protein YkvA (DUF1232 family)